MPILARVYHIPPPDQRRLALSEFRDLQRDYARLMQEGGE